MKKDTENLNIVLEKEKKKYKSKIYVLFGFVGLLWSLFIFLYFFLMVQKLLFPEEAELDARVKSNFFLI